MSLPPELRGLDAFLYNWLHWLFKLFLLIGLVVIVMLTTGAENKVLTPVIGVAVFFLILSVLATWYRRSEKRFEARVAIWNEKQKAQERSIEEESRTIATWGERGRATRGKAPEKAVPARAVEAQSSVDPALRSNNVDWEALKLDGFPTFQPHEIRFDESIPEEGFEDDTLVDDTTGHGVDLQDGLFAEGLWVAFELLDLEESEWTMRPWGYEMLFAIEAIAAAAGQPSRSRQLGHLRDWATRVSYRVTPDLVEKMLSLIDYYLEKVHADPEGKDLNPEALDAISEAGYLMHSRIARLAE